MRWNPVVNAFAAAAYIGLIDIGFQLIVHFKQNTPDTSLDAMVVLSALVFSAAVMAFLFFYQPAALLLENKKAEALSYFLKTLGTFGAITIVIFVALTLLPA